jgi:hypothetical protein
MKYNTLPTSATDLTTDFLFISHGNHLITGIKDVPFSFYEYRTQTSNDLAILVSQKQILSFQKNVIRFFI